MRYEARPPRIELDAFVKCLWRLRGAPWEIEPQPIVPDGCFELIVHLGEPFVEREVYSPAAAAGPTEPLLPAREAKQGRLLLAATLTRTVVVAASGEVDVVGVRFHPGRAYPFLSLAAHEIVDTVAAAPDVIARELASVLARLEPAATEELFAAIEGALLGRLARAGSDPRFDRLAAALAGAEGQSVASLAAAAGISLRQFERLFKSRAGVGAKVLQRVVRFHRVATRLLEGTSRSGAPTGSPDLATLALDAGFFDQAHMSHEFRVLADLTPSRYPAQAGALDRLFASL